MPVFSYQAYNKAGRLVEGEMVADRADLIGDIVAAQGLVLIQVRGAGQNNTPWWNREIYTIRKSSSVSLALFTRELSSFLSAGLRTTESLAAIGDTSRDEIGVFAGEIGSRVSSGQTLSQALQASKQEVPESYIAMIEAGESSGQLGDVLNLLADTLAREEALAEKIRGALIYPVMLLVAALGTIMVAVLGVVPRLAPLLEGRESDLPAATRVLLSMSNLGASQWLMVAAVCLVGSGLVFAAVRRSKVRQRIMRVWRKLPLIGPLLRTRQWAQFCRTFGLMLKNDVGLVQAMRISARTIADEEDQRAVLDAADEIRAGSSFADVMKRIGRLPAGALRLMASGDKAGRLAEMTLNSAVRLEAEVESRTNKLNTVLPMLLTLIMGLIVAVVIASVFSVILSVNEVSI